MISATQIWCSKLSCSIFAVLFVEQNSTALRFNHAIVVYPRQPLPALRPLACTLAPDTEGLASQLTDIDSFSASENTFARSVE
jgi:hypothetical protein